MKNISWVLQCYILSTIPKELWFKTGIYKITNLKSHKIYIGSTGRTFRNRFYYHIKHLSENIHCNYKLQKDFNKYGISKFSFEIIEVVNDPHDIIKREQVYLDLYQPFYNILKIAGSSLGFKMSCEQIEKTWAKRRKNVDEFQVINFYKKSSFRKTQKQFGIAQERILKILKKHNISSNQPNYNWLKNPRKKYDEKLITDLYLNGKTIVEIQKEQHLSFEKIKEIFIKHNIIVIRSQSTKRWHAKKKLI